MKYKKFILLLMFFCAVNSLTAQFGRFNKQEPIPPIYKILDFLATHPIRECAEKEIELKDIISVPNFDVNLRYNDFYPPLAYLVRKNYDYLGYFSKEYISDNVLMMLIEKGARINTYDREGNSLMAFALETDNEYLSQWFIDNGIDLGKTNKFSEDIINKCIDEQNFTILKQVTATVDGEKMLNVDYLNQAIKVGNFEIVKHIHEKGIDINVNTLTVAPGRFAGNSQLYDYITQICANNAVEYNDLRKHKMLFPDKFYLIKSKIDAIYYAEIKPIDHAFELIKQFVKMDEPEKTMMFFESPSAQKKVDVPAENKISERELSISNRADYARKFIQKHSGYDPENKIILAYHILDFNTVMVGLNTVLLSTYLKVINDGFWKKIIAESQKDFRTRDVLEKQLVAHDKQINDAFNMANKLDINNTFGKTWWFDEAMIELKRKGSQLHDIWERDKVIYKADQEKAKAKRQESIEIERVEAEQRKIEICLQCRIDKTKTTIPKKTEYILYTAEKPGKIFTENGEVYWYWWDEKKGLYVKGYIWNDYYDTYESMEARFVKECLSKHNCK